MHNNKHFDLKNVYNAIQLALKKKDIFHEISQAHSDKYSSLISLRNRAQNLKAEVSLYWYGLQLNMTAKFDRFS